MPSQAATWPWALIQIPATVRPRFHMWPSVAINCQWWSRHSNGLMWQCSPLTSAWSSLASYLKLCLLAQCTHHSVFLSFPSLHHTLVHQSGTLSSCCEVWQPGSEPFLFVSSFGFIFFTLHSDIFVSWDNIYPEVSYLMSIWLYLLSFRYQAHKWIFHLSLLNLCGFKHIVSFL